MWTKTAISLCLGMSLGAMALNPFSRTSAVTDPPPNGNPTGREPGSTRGPCEQGTFPFTPLLPVSDSGFSGTTLNRHPSFWFYVPYASDQGQTGRFSLVSQDGSEMIYRADITLPATPGFAEVAIPATAPDLQIDNTYQWQFILYCGDPAALVPDFVIHRGTIQRIDAAALASPLATDGLTQRVRGLLQNQVWYDATADLAAIQAVPDLWAEVLTALGLTNLESVSTFDRVETVPE